MKTIIILMIVIISGNNLFSKTNIGTIVLLNSDEIEARYIEVNDSTITYTGFENKLTKSVKKEDVRLLRLKDGNHVFEGLGFGALSGLALYFTLPVIINYERDYMGYFIVTGVLLGAITGSFNNKIETRIINRKVSTSFLNKVNFLTKTNVVNYQLVSLSFCL